MPAFFQNPAQREAHQRLVIHDQNLHYASILSCTRKTAPCPGSDAQEISPPNWRTNSRLKLKPKPVPSPSDLVVKKGSKMRSCRSLGMPGPLSATSSVAQCSSRKVRTLTSPFSAKAW